MNKVKGFLFQTKYEGFFLIPTSFFQLLVLSSDSLVTTLFSLKAKRRSLTVTTSSHHLLHQCMLTLDLHLPPPVRSSLDKPMLLLSYLLYLLSLAAAAAMATTQLQLYRVQSPHRPSRLLFLLQQRRCLRLPNLFRRRTLIRTLPRLAGPPPRGVNLGWITIVITVGYLMSHVTITISSTTIIEFPATSSCLCFVFVVVFCYISLSGFWCWIFCDQIWYEFSGSILSRFSLGLNSLNIYINVHISHLPISFSGI
jgi:hypothetical protein